MQDLARTLALNPAHFGALAGLGAILEDTDQPERALEAYRAAAAIHPHQPSIKRALERLERRVSGFEA
jgi:cytochrome c-type biogenesis protein CcmH/NrfG